MQIGDCACRCASPAFGELQVPGRRGLRDLGPSEQSASADEQTAALGGLEPRGVAGLARGLLAENLAVQLH